MQLDDESLSRILDEMPPEEPPADLRQNIMRAVTLTTRVAYFDDARRNRRLTFIIAWAAAAALVFGFLLFSRVIEHGNTVATMTAAPIVITESDRLVTIAIRTPGSITVRWDPKAAELVAISGASDASSLKDQTTFMLRSPSPRAAVTLRARRESSSVALSVSVNGKEAHSERVALK
jgi:hypothetical protein